MQEFDATHVPLQVIIAAWNEEEGIGYTIAELKEHLSPLKILVVDGNSVDRTANMATSSRSRSRFSRSPRQRRRICQRHKKYSTDVNYVIITDADFTYPAEYIPKMIQILEQNPSVGMVCGNRFTEHLDPRALHSVFYFGNRLIAFTHNFLNGVQLADPLTGLRVVRAEILRNWKVQSRGFDIEVELNHRCERRGFGIMEVPIKYRERLGQKKLAIKHGAEILRRIMIETTY